MNDIEKHAAYYRAYLADDRSLAQVAGVLVAAVAAWLLFYLVSLVGPPPQTSGPANSALRAAHMEVATTYRRPARPAPPEAQDLRLKR